MAGCCCQGEYGRFFGRRRARLDARLYRRRGLNGTAADLVRLAGDVRGATVLDVGGGVGAIDLELLAAGAERATNVELSPEYEQEARVLAAERGVGDRVERRIADFVDEADALEPHDVVVLHRVVCCYADVDALLGAAAARTRRRLVLTYPQERPLVRLGIRTINIFLRARGSSFRTYVHPMARMASAAGAHGLALERREPRGRIWESAVFAAGSRATA